MGKDIAGKNNAGAASGVASNKHATGHGGKTQKKRKGRVGCKRVKRPHKTGYLRRGKTRGPIATLKQKKDRRKGGPE